MKKMISIVSLLAIVLTGCSGFLDEVDKDKLIPQSTEHYAAVLLHEFSFQQAAFYFSSDFMADNITEYEHTTEGSRKQWKPVYTWQIEIELNENGDRLGNNEAWTEMYEDIAIANYVIEQIDGASGSQAERDFVKGEAYFVRGWSYLELANLYGIPYRKGTAGTALGVPLRTDNAIEQTYSRASLEDTYSLILSDLGKARELIAASGLQKTKYHPNVPACDLLLSRAFLYMQDWEKAEEYATRVIETGRLSRMTDDSPFVTEERNEILYTTAMRLGSDDATVFDGGWMVSHDFLDLFHNSDLRKKAFFSKIPGKMGIVYYPQKRSSTFTGMGRNYLRVAEAYLNRAEARCRQQKDGSGDLRTLLESRYSDRSAIVIAPAGGLLEQVLLERRKELCFEGHHRWFDLRRMEHRPTIIHRFTLTDGEGVPQGTQQYTLFPDDLNYTLPIPMKEREHNPLIRNNERYEKLPEML